MQAFAVVNSTSAWNLPVNSRGLMLRFGTGLRTCPRVLVKSVHKSQLTFFQQNRQIRSALMASASILPDDIPNNAQPLNVLGTSLERHSVSPITRRPIRFGGAHYRWCSFGVCMCFLGCMHYFTRSPVLQPSLFLDFSASRGNDLSTPHPPAFPGLTSGCRWCLCVNRWKEALLAYRSGDISRDAVPKYVIVHYRLNASNTATHPRVVLSATDSSALRTVSLGDLREFSFDSSRGEPETNLTRWGMFLSGCPKLNGVLPEPHGVFATIGGCVLHQGVAFGGPTSNAVNIAMEQYSVKSITRSYQELGLLITTSSSFPHAKFLGITFWPRRHPSSYDILETRRMQPKHPDKILLHGMIGTKSTFSSAVY
ncbi:hypothetical protein AG1IA_05563 [Rhizoctonia solani AG-1 IA]|uniref:Uncharacterized protein n=1 Tax=Thanatephorus cucumeris (strain AG1-IA) TaxID=983506 RepID=L8WUH6_THACA|nr:hypothetical protein AG1IA_05563 [Rhizoctonia solani AG-1 IA]